jgi:hypothetical protein
MKILKITDISSSNAMPIKAGTLQFLQDAHKETVAGLVSNLIPNADVNTIYILSGCQNSTVAPIHTLSAGVLYYNGEIFNFDGATFTLTGLQKAYARIETTQFITNADPVQFTDGVSRNVHNVRKIVIENTITSSGLPEFEDFIMAGHWLKGDTKEVVCDSTYLTANFDSSGLGRLERLGWAIMNGNNGTPNDNGKVVISYGTDYTTLEATGGSRDAVVVSHVHTFGSSAGTDGGGSGAQVITTGTVSEGAGTFGMTTAGVSGTDKNMQPYVVRLRIMKI